MTLHWWMHWFWVTSLITLHASIVTAAPQLEDPKITTDQPDLPLRVTRQPRAMYFDKAPAITTLVPLNITENQTEKETEPHTDSNTSIANTPAPIANTTTADVVQPSIFVTAANTNESYAKTKANITEAVVTEGQNTTFAPKKRNLTRPDVVKDERNVEGVAESRIFTEKPLSLETTYQQTRVPPNIESSRRVIDQNENGMDTGAIAGISFAALVLVALAGSTAFVLYRRRYLNKPQTLNDKCSNPDSSGYLDDSTIRDNSEEMYSLDNDSFLNSLEAMTIQNYWTDTVKHTKL